MQKYRDKILLAVKLLIAFSLIFWLVETGKLDFRDIRIYWQSPRILVMNVIFWLFGAVFFCALRWRALVKGLRVSLSRFHAVRLNLIGLFFNTIMPGAVGGDLVKAMYLCRGGSRQIKTSIFLTVFLDRILGLIALLLISFVGILLNWQVVANNDVLRPIFYFIVLFFIGALGFGVVVLVPQVQERLKWLVWLRGKLLQFSFFEHIYLALRTYKDKPKSLLVALLYALLHQSLFILVFLTVTFTVVQKQISVGLLMTILPIGIITTAIPLAPGGLGVGHVAFEKLFQLINLSGGANIFNIIVLGQISLNLLGAIPYIFNKAEVERLLKNNALELSSSGSKQ